MLGLIYEIIIAIKCRREDPVIQEIFAILDQEQEEMVEGYQELVDPEQE